MALSPEIIATYLDGCIRQVESAVKGQTIEGEALTPPDRISQLAGGVLGIRLNMRRIESHEAEYPGELLARARRVYDTHYAEARKYYDELEEKHHRKIHFDLE